MIIIITIIVIVIILMIMIIVPVNIIIIIVNIYHDQGSLFIASEPGPLSAIRPSKLSHKILSQPSNK